MLTIDDIPGLSSGATCASLRELGRRVRKDRAIIEIGTYKGRSSIALARDAKAHVWTIDPWDHPENVGGRHCFTDPGLREVFESHVELVGMQDRITQIQDFAVNVARRWASPKVGLLFIDGDHDERNVVADYEAWEPHLAKDAIVVFDDYGTPRNPGVRDAIESMGLGVIEVMPDALAVIEWN